MFWVVDNGSSHRGQASVDRLEGAWPNLRLIHLPVHASWLNQIEIVFSIIQRKVVNPNDFFDLDQITDRLAAFEDRYNQLAEPFDWTLHPRRPGNELLERIATHDPAAPRTASRRVSRYSPGDPSLRDHPDTGRRRNPAPPPGCRPSPLLARNDSS